MRSNARVALHEKLKRETCKVLVVVAGGCGSKQHQQSYLQLVIDRSKTRCICGATGTPISCDLGLE